MSGLLPSLGRLNPSGSECYAIRERAFRPVAATTKAAGSSYLNDNSGRTQIRGHKKTPAQVRIDDCIPLSPIIFSGFEIIVFLPDRGKTELGLFPFLT
ncbi:MAG: hypothetical protein CEE38_10880 [Planctomycetes bacterium B3_Pla]|nr:MAG: hypothetical protein CEE38_10880 [Planctomycetes bacterium B3_Pla]